MPQPPPDPESGPETSADGSASSLDPSLIGPATSEISAPARDYLDRARHGIPRRLGKYTVKRLINSGGMGSVFEAIQENPRRVVALKVIKPGLASRSALRRFEYESQILARLRHPGIAQVYEAGSEPDGGATGAGGGEPIPYFVMEYIPNARPINEYAAVHDLPLAEKLALFVKVCEAVHHGHTKGIIHRDLKPGNILVDSAGNPKVIDFGVARATDSDMAVTTLQTDVGQLLGTMQWMSPEQVEADPHDIDTRSDVYALGVVLFELVTGQLPYDIIKAPVYEAARVIREQAPARPSSLSYIARGDLETILLKALEKDRNRRYRSAAELADDLNRYLGHEPVSARGGSVLYELRKFARRNRVLFATFVTIGATLVGTSIVLYMAAAHARQSAGEAARKGEVAENTTELLRKLMRLDEEQLAADPAAGRKDLDQIAALVAGPPRLIGDDRLAADVHAHLARSYFQLGHLTEAARHAEAGLEHYRNILTESSAPQVVALNTIAGLAARAESRSAVAHSHLMAAMEGSRGRLDTVNNFAVQLLESGDARAGKDGMDRLESALTIAPPGPTRQLLATNLGLARLAAGRLFDAELLSMQHVILPVPAIDPPWLAEPPLHGCARVRSTPNLELADMKSIPELPELRNSMALVPAGALSDLRARLSVYFSGGALNTRGETTRRLFTEACAEHLAAGNTVFLPDHFRRLIAQDDRFARLRGELDQIDELLGVIEALPIERGVRESAILRCCKNLWPEARSDSARNLSRLCTFDRLEGLNYWRRIVNGNDTDAAYVAAAEWAERNMSRSRDQGLCISIRAGALMRLKQYERSSRFAMEAFELNRRAYRTGARADLCIQAYSEQQLGRHPDAVATLQRVLDLTARSEQGILTEPGSPRNEYDDYDTAALYTLAAKAAGVAPVP